MAKEPWLFASQFNDLMAMLPWVRLKKEKEAMRGIMEQRRRIYPREQVKADSTAIMERIEQLPQFQEAKVVLVYYPIHHEVDLRSLMTKYESEKTFLLPVSHRHYIEVRPYAGEELMAPGRFGIPEPKTLQYKGNIDMVIVPGVAFDTHLHRLGRGKGYYDKFLKDHSSSRVGVAFDFQVRKTELPHNSRDSKMDLIITPTQTIGE